VQLDVPTASPYYDVTGGGPVLLPLPGGAADGAALTRLALLGADACTIVTHRPTGISRSSVMDRDADTTVATQADDAGHVLAAVSPDPACVFGLTACREKNV
jgi:hypothetical protein